MRYLGIGAFALALSFGLHAQLPLGPPAPTVFSNPQQPPAQPPPQQQRPAQPQPVQNQNQNPAAPQNAAAQAAPPQGTQPQAGPAAAPRLTETGALRMNNVSLSEMIDVIAQQLKINYILDPRVKGSVTVYTYGEVRGTDLMPLLETILRVNGATMVKVGDLYRIIPVNSVSQMPLEPMINADSKTLPDDESMVLNLIFLKYATAAEMDALLAPFLGEGASHKAYEPANLLIIQDNARNMRRTMQLISLFDADTFAGQRVRLFSVENSRPSDLVKDLDTVFKAYALSEKNGAVRFIPVDRINTVIAVAPNPGIFPQVEDWIKKLDVPVKITAGAVNNYVYRLKYGRAETVAAAIMALYTGNVGALIAMAQQANAGLISSGMGVAGAVGGYGGIGGGNMYGANAYGNAFGANAYGANPYGASPYGAYGAGYPGAYNAAAPNAAAPAGTAPAGGIGQTGAFLGATAQPGAIPPGVPHVIPNPFDNTLLIQASPQEYEQITNLLRQLDIPPRQVLIDAKIYEVDLTHDINGSVASCLQAPGTCAAALGGTGITPSRAFAGLASSAGIALTAGALLNQNHELMGVLNALESQGKTKVISAPSIVATDSIPATINVGSQIPVATSTVPSGVQTGGNTVFAQTVTQQSTGVTLSITAHVNSSGIVTMVINQQVSAPQPSSVTAQYSNLNSPSFSNRSMATQVTVQDGDTVAIGGAITEQWSQNSSGVPVLNRIPVLGFLFGSKTYSKSRDELIIFLTPRVIYDTIQLDDATDEIRSNLKHLQPMMKDQ